MQAYLLTKTGNPDVLRLHDVPEPEPAPGEVRVRVRWIGLNYAEILSRKGLYGWAPKRPYIPGMEAFGEIDAVGVGVTGRSVGEPVIVGAQYGCYAEKVCVPAHQALPALPQFSPEENAAFAVNYMTAWIALMKMARLQTSDTVFISPAAGGVGTAAVQLSKAFGCRTLGVAGRAEKIELLQKLGIDLVINYREQNFEPVVREFLSGGGIDVAVEMVGGEVFKACQRLLNPFGRIVVVGFASLNLQKWNPLSWWRTWRDLPKMRLQQMAEGSFGILSSHVGYLLSRVELMTAIWQELVDFVTRHDIRPVIGRVFSFDAMPDAHRWIESRQSYGKVLIQGRL
ncbi:MAG: NADPH:quinone oxidoreductase family protein [candidate division KSB1 bacterium]|nr:NADPH:quinone oxidoreductase family protein [candidate division KSB1 bacterium]MDQ7063646.1 NADPH:quinone oxidoreductase family protein [candidate division KSB1 bacterium]